jgi:hypothetical protein
MTAMRKLILYYQPECHLCVEAEGVLEVAGLADNYLKVDISADPELLMRYEIHVPVLQHVDDQKELFWPFDQEDLERFVQAGK